ERLTRIRQLATDLHLDEALRLAEQSVRQFPAEADYWHVYAELARRLPMGASYQRVMATLFVNAGHKAMSVAFLRAQLADYRQRSPQAIVLRGAAGAALARRYFREGASRDLDALLDGLHRGVGMDAAFRELLHTLLQVAEKNADKRRAQRLRQYLATLDGAGQTAAEPS